MLDTKDMQLNKEGLNTLGMLYILLRYSLSILSSPSRLLLPLLTSSLPSSLLSFPSLIISDDTL